MSWSTRTIDSSSSLTWLPTSLSSAVTTTSLSVRFLNLRDDTGKGGQRFTGRQFVELAVAIGDLGRGNNDVLQIHIAGIFHNDGEDGRRALGHRLEGRRHRDLDARVDDRNLGDGVVAVQLAVVHAEADVAHRAGVGVRHVGGDLIVDRPEHLLEVGDGVRPGQEKHATAGAEFLVDVGAGHVGVEEFLVAVLAVDDDDRRALHHVAVNVGDIQILPGDDHRAATGHERGAEAGSLAAAVQVERRRVVLGAEG